MSGVSIIYIGNDTVLTLEDLTNGLTGLYVNDAAVTATLVDAAGASITGEAWPVTLDYVSSSNGTYQAMLKDTLPLTKNASYIAKITANAGDNLKAYWEIDLVCQVRK